MNMSHLAFGVIQGACCNNFNGLQVHRRHQLGLYHPRAIAKSIRRIIRAPNSPMVTVFVTAHTITTRVRVFRNKRMNLFGAFIVTGRHAHLAQPKINSRRTTFNDTFRQIAFIVSRHQLRTRRQAYYQANFRLNDTERQHSRRATDFNLPPNVSRQAFLITSFFPMPLPHFQIG